MCYPSLLDDNGHVTDNLFSALAKSPFPCEQAMYLEKACFSNGEDDFLAEQQCLCGGNYFEAYRGCYECYYAHGFFDAQHPRDEALSQLTSASSAECSATPITMRYTNLYPTGASTDVDVETLTSDRFPSDTAVANYWTGATAPIAGQITGSATSTGITEAGPGGGGGTSSTNPPSPSSTNGAAEVKAAGGLLAVVIGAMAAL